MAPIEICEENENDGFFCLFACCCLVGFNGFAISRHTLQWPTPSPRVLTKTNSLRLSKPLYCVTQKVKISTHNAFINHFITLSAFISTFNRPPSSLHTDLRKVGAICYDIRGRFVIGQLGWAPLSDVTLLNQYNNFLRELESD